MVKKLISYGKELLLIALQNWIFRGHFIRTNGIELLFRRKHTLLRSTLKPKEQGVELDLTVRKELKYGRSLIPISA